MIDFMVVALPRSGTTWAANWLTTDKTICLHDEMAYRTYSELEKEYKTNKKLGLSDTGLFAYQDKLNKHPAKKVILHRDIEEINESLANIYLQPMPEEFVYKLNEIEGLHVHYTDLFNKPKPIWDYLIGTEFDEERHNVLKQMQIQPEFAALEPVSKDAMQRYFSEIFEHR